MKQARINYNIYFMEFGYFSNRINTKFKACLFATLKPKILILMSIRIFGLRVANRHALNFVFIRLEK